MTLTIDLITKISTNKKDFIIVYYCQVIEINSLDKGNINNISKDIIVLQQEMIYHGGYLANKGVSTSDINNLY